MFPLSRKRLSAMTIRQMPSCAQVAEEFHLSVYQCQRLAQTGQWPALKIAGQWRFHRKIREWVGKEMYRQMAVRQRYCRPLNGRAHPPKEFPEVVATPRALAVLHALKDDEQFLKLWAEMKKLLDKYQDLGA